MFPEDRVLVAYVPDPRDFDLIRDQGWYRIPQRHAPKGLHAEYIAFYFGNRFGSKKWAVHYFARNLGHELTYRRTLFPDQPHHKRAGEIYYKIQLGPLQQCDEPIPSLRWRRLTFIHTTWDRFQHATEINDLYIEGDQYVDRLYATLKDRGIQSERNYRIEEGGVAYFLPLTVHCRQGRIEITNERLPASDAGVDTLLDEILRETAARGGAASAPPQTVDL